MPTPDLDHPCGEHFTYRDFVECGETWSRLASPAGESIDNAPRVPETFAALRSLCETVLDPAVKRFGRVVLTYGFASPRLTRHIRGRIAPALDQHASHELNRAGRADLLAARCSCGFHRSGRRQSRGRAVAHRDRGVRSALLL